MQGYGNDMSECFKSWTAKAGWGIGQTAYSKEQSMEY